MYQLVIAGLWSPTLKYIKAMKVKNDIMPPQPNMFSIIQKVGFASGSKLFSGFRFMNGIIASKKRSLSEIRDLKNLGFFPPYIKYLINSLISKFEISQ